MKPKLIIHLNLIALVFTASILCHAQSVPKLVNYQGKLTDSNGAPLSSGTYGVAFRLWSASTNTDPPGLIWGQEFTSVAVVSGVFNVILGAPGGIVATNAAVNDISFAFNDPNRYLGLTVTRGPNNAPIANPTEILPRQQLLSTPYAFSALNAVNAINGVPAGTVVQYAGTNAPSGFLLCDGNAYSSKVYSNLFVAIGTNWGAGSGTNNFSVPDFRGRTAFGAGVGGSDTKGNALTARFIAQKGGEEAHQLSIAEMPAHQHAMKNGGPNGGYGPNSGSPNWPVQPLNYYGPGTAGGENTGAIRSDGGGMPHNNMPPYTVVNYIIKY